MLVSFNWLSEYVEHNLSAEDVADILTNTGLEVEGIEKYSNYKNIPESLVIGLVNSVEKHPNADKLTLCKVTIGLGNDLDIICGAPNVKTGQKVVVAPIGTELNTIKGERFEIKKSKIRGVTSEGMICAEDEIGLSDDHSGIMVLPEDTIVGKSFKESLNIYEDQIFEIAITPNRGDAISHLGVARDLAAALNKKVKYPGLDNFFVNEISTKVEIEIKEPELCPRYSGIVVSGIKVGESPVWLQNKLKAIGIGSINNIVDVANYVMFEVGQPLHAFDLDKVEGFKVEVKKVAKGTTFKSIDEVERELSGNEIMICDKLKPIAIGGVIGGLNSMVTEETADILIESAYFNPSSIRNTSKIHGIQTDASYRFERGTDPNNTIYALKRAALLIMKVAGGSIASDIIDEYPEKITEKKIELSSKYVNSILGNNIKWAEVKNVLINLEFKIEEISEETVIVTVPSYRPDVDRPIDLVEEFLRIYSYNKIEFDRQVKTIIQNQPESAKYGQIDQVSNYLIANGFYEILSPSFVSSEYLEKRKVKNKERLIKTLNSVNKNLDTLRDNIVYAGLDAIRYNFNRNYLNLKFFEIASTYSKADGDFIENERLALWLTGDQNDSNWYYKSNKIDVYYLKSIVQNILQLSGINPQPNLEKTSNDSLSYGLDYKVDETIVASIGLLDNNIAGSFDITSDVFFADIDLNSLIRFKESLNIKFKKPSKYPFVIRDLAFIIKKEINFNDIRINIRSRKYKTLKELVIFDVYEGENIEKGYKSYAVRMKFQDEEGTLRDKQVEKIIASIIEILEKEFNAKIRK